MKNIIASLLLIACFCVVTTQASWAQTKIGHLNSAELLSAMPATKSAEKQLETYTKQLENQLKQKLKAFESDFGAVQEKVKKGLLNPQQIATEEKRFQDKQKELQKFEFDAQQKVAKKRDELLKPILTKVENAIKGVAKAQGYSYILDLSMGFILYGQPSEDVTAKVKSKLGI